MAAPITTYVQLPLDTGNTGKKIRAISRVVGADTVLDHTFIPTSRRGTLGRHKAATPVLTVPIAVHTGLLTGFAWLYNPVGSAVLMAIDRISFDSQFIALDVDLLAGELRVSRFTFTGVNSGALVTPSKNDSNYPTAVGQFATTSATWSPTLGATAYAFQHQTMDLVTGGGGHWSPLAVNLVPDDEDDQIILRAGEGLSFWHAVAVTTANRRLYINVAWEEYEG